MSATTTIRAPIRTRPSSRWLMQRARRVLEQHSYQADAALPHAAKAHVVAGASRPPGVQSGDLGALLRRDVLPRGRTLLLT